MEYYDAAIGVQIDASTEKLLGFRKIFVAGKDFKLVDMDLGKEDPKNSIAMGKTSLGLLKASRRFAKGIIPVEIDVDKRVVESIKENESMLLIPLNRIVSTYGIVRARNIKIASKVLEYALKRRVSVGFITMASSETQLMSFMQLIELAKLIGAPEDVARAGISEINERIGEATP
ncbi:MAG: hypothetical protein ACP5FR_02860 [Candidatus Micrarchaeia archaeon]